MNGRNFISVGGGDIPERIQYFTVYITEVMEDMPEGSNYARRYGKQVFWTISLIKMKEYRFSIGEKRFCKHEL